MEVSEEVSVKQPGQCSRLPMLCISITERQIALECKRCLRTLVGYVRLSLSNWAKHLKGICRIKMTWKADDPNPIEETVDKSERIAVVHTDRITWR